MDARKHDGVHPELHIVVDLGISDPKLAILAPVRTPTVFHDEIFLGIVPSDDQNAVPTGELSADMRIDTAFVEPEVFEDIEPDRNRCLVDRLLQVIERPRHGGPQVQDIAPSDPAMTGRRTQAIVRAIGETVFRDGAEMFQKRGRGR